jgi:hypothetical protein
MTRVLNLMKIYQLVKKFQWHVQGAKLNENLPTGSKVCDMTRMLNLMKISQLVQKFQWHDQDAEFHENLPIGSNLLVMEPPKITATLLTIASTEH